MFRWDDQWSVLASGAYVLSTYGCVVDSHQQCWDFQNYRFNTLSRAKFIMVFFSVDNTDFLRWKDFEYQCIAFVIPLKDLEIAMLESSWKDQYEKNLKDYVIVSFICVDIMFPLDLLTYILGTFYRYKVQRTSFRLNNTVVRILYCSFYFSFQHMKMLRFCQNVKNFSICVPVYF